jgi:hypothetical protein
MGATAIDEVEWIKFLNWVRTFKIKVSLEEMEQIRLFCWIKTIPELDAAFHIANERKCHRLVGQILKLMGVKPGVPDIFFPIARGRYHGLWIELKAGKNKATSSQQWYLDKLNAAGYRAECVTGYQAARELIERYLSYDVSYL